MHEEFPPILVGADLVRSVICSLNGGYNGRNPNLRLGIVTRSDGVIDYTLTDSDGVEQLFTVTITPT